MKTKQDMYCNLKIDSLESFNGDIQLPPNSKYTLVIDYPLEHMHSITIKIGKKGISQASLLKIIGEEYHHIYDNPDKFGIWGHNLGDLYLEQLHVNHETKIITLAIGS